ncbi:MAG: hypothetical protein JNL73_20260 [Anaerolineales bacterium]|nr:hypothetical protein [Anaerolineales bacterium]
MSRRWLLLAFGLVVMALGLALWAYGALTSRGRVVTESVPAVIWTMVP